MSINIYLDAETTPRLANVEFVGASGTDWRFRSAVAIPPPVAIVVPPGFTRLMTAQIGFTVQGNNPGQALTVDATDFAQFFGRSDIHQIGNAWPRRRWDHEDGTMPTDWLVSGAFLVIRSIRPTDILIAKLPPIPAAGRWSQGSITPQSNVSGGGPALDMALGRIGGSFDPASGNAVALAHPFNQNPSIRFGIGEGVASAGSYYDIDHGAEVYLSMRLAPTPGHAMPSSWPIALIGQMPRRMG